MKRKRVRTTDNKKLKFSKTLFLGSFIYNPILTQAIGICTVVAVGTTLKLSLMFSLILSILLIINELLSSLLLNKLSRWIRISVYMLISMLLLIPLMIHMDRNMSEIYASLGIYLPLLAVNSIIVIRCEAFAVNNTVRNSLFDALAASIGFTAVSVITGTVRELISYGTIFGKSVSHLPVFSGMALPFGGLLVIAFLAALQKWIIQKKFRRYPTNSFNMRTAFDKPSFRNEGINATDGSLSIINDPVSTPVSVEEYSADTPDGKSDIDEAVSFILSSDEKSENVQDSSESENDDSNILPDKISSESITETEDDSI